MTDADFDFAGYDHSSGMGTWADLRQAKLGLRHGVNLAAGVVSLALLAGGVVWSYNLAVREAKGVPVIQAAEGPMRATPTDPGGEIVDYQGLAVNTVAAVGAAAPLPERLVLAPRPVELTSEDVALDLAAPTGPVAPVAPLAEGGQDSPVLAAEPPLESAGPVALAIDAALAEALGEGTDGLADDSVLPDVDVALAMEPGTAGEIVLSPRPKPRPTTSAPEPLIGDATPQVLAAEVDPATIRPGTRLVQFGAFDTPDEARAEWARLEGRFGELMEGKGLVLQPAESGGRSFIRLRAHGFEDEADARRFCAAFSAEGNICIPVPQR